MFSGTLTDFNNPGVITKIKMSSSQRLRYPAAQMSRHRGMNKKPININKDITYYK